MTLPWDTDFALRAPMFAPLRRYAQILRGPMWPDCTALNGLLAARAVPVTNAAGLPLVFVPQAPRQAAFEERFEPRIFLRGEVQVRAENWHDLFNALVWLTFPRAKAALNHRHYHALRGQQMAGAENRGPQQDALTLFDEGGVIVASSKTALAEMLRNHAWKQLFWQHRDELTASLEFYLFGHALYEKALQPFDGVTGRGIVVEVASGFFAQTIDRQLAELDERLAQLLNDATRFTATRELTAVPILGIPGWCAANARATYYDNSSYFRPLRSAGRR